MLRIARADDESGAEVFRLEGKVVGRWVDELRRCCREILARPGARLTLDLAEVSFIDPDGLALFEELGERVALANCSPFAAELLRDARGRRQ